MQKSVFRIMGSDYLTMNFDKFVFPLYSVFQIIVMIMYIIFMVVIFKYKGSYRKLAGILMIVVYCIVNVASPFINVLDRFLTSKLKDSEELSALSAIDSFMIFVSPFTVVASVLLIIAIGRYGISKSEQENLPETQEG
ncbi:MAG: hypothetical protein J6X60_09325 [Ruminiclostridium sp.]|nr:hypothetical protein [Ruminiclostridium sp.]